ncbi:uncharacterized protein [Zea mays]|uniref:uncharacterized protein n=1 Tax=Zea mays TaxID=4577 RepID=UPI0009A989C1|nr:uncharacterized protein LOC109941238 [Zea mays]|eukprot:XP_020397379.1 uncharacterized protein LOC109941238 [Zea mays]
MPSHARAQAMPLPCQTCSSPKPPPLSHSSIVTSTINGASWHVFLWIYGAAIATGPREVCSPDSSASPLLSYKSDPFCPATRSPPLRCSRPRRITPIGAADALCHRRGRLEADAVLPSTFLRAVLCSSPPFESSKADCVVEDLNLFEDDPQDMLEQEGDAGDFDGDFDDEF